MDRGNEDPMAEWLKSERKRRRSDEDDGSTDSSGDRKDRKHRRKERNEKKDKKDKRDKKDKKRERKDKHKKSRSEKDGSGSALSSEVDARHDIVVPKAITEVAGATVQRDSWMTRPSRDAPAPVLGDSTLAHVASAAAATAPPSNWRERLLGLQAAAHIHAQSPSAASPEDKERRNVPRNDSEFERMAAKKEFLRPVANAPHRRSQVQAPRVAAAVESLGSRDSVAGSQSAMASAGALAGDCRSEGRVDAAMRDSASVEQATKVSAVVVEQSDVPVAAAASDGAGPRGQDSPAVTVPTEKELNQIAARLMRAEMMGDDALAATLKQRLEDGRRLAAASVPGSRLPHDNRPIPADRRPPLSRDAPRDVHRGRREDSGGEERDVGRDGRREEVHVLASVTRSGAAIPLSQRTIDAANASVESAAEVGRRKRNKMGSDGAGLSITDMVREERADDGSRYDGDMARSIATAVQYMREVDGEGHTGKFHDNDDEMAPDVADLFERGNKTRNARDEERTVAKAQRQASQASKFQEKCIRCLDGPSGLKHVVVSHGISAYLALPEREPLCDGHCIIVPASHVAAINMVDEDVWDEIQIFKKFLTKMFAGQDKDVVFIETVMGLKFQPHAVIECIPIPAEEGAVAPMYFKKAITEAGSEWAQHRKLIDTKGRGIRRSVPPGFPYFNVEFAMDGGYATVIEDEVKFNKLFGKEIVGGMLDIEPHVWTRPRTESSARQAERRRHFEAQWKPFDWTVRLRDDKRG